MVRDTQQAIICQRDSKMDCTDGVVRVQECDCFFEHAREDLHEKVGAITTTCFRLALLKVLLPYFTNRLADLLQTKNLS